MNSGADGQDMKDETAEVIIGARPGLLCNPGKRVHFHVSTARSVMHYRLTAEALPADSIGAA